LKHINIITGCGEIAFIAPSSIRAWLQSNKCWRFTLKPHIRLLPYKRIENDQAMLFQAVAHAENFLGGQSSVTIQL